MESTFREALAHQNAGRLEDAEALYRQAAGWRPAWTLANLGVILRVTGRLDEAEAVLREALSHDPGNAGIRHSLGMTLIQLGKYPEGWLHYEARHELKPTPAPPLPLWRGEPLAGKRILVVAEQGLGDQILFSRFIPLLVAQGADVQFAASKALVPLFQPLPAKVFYPTGWDGLTADYCTPLGSVPHGLGGAGPADAPAPYLPLPTPDRAPSGTGLMLEGAAVNGNNTNRLPNAGVARAIRGLADFTDLAPAASGARDFAETAAIMSGLERIVSVDTSTAHLAGAIGKPCFVLMSRPAIDWYANWSDDRTPWYPSLRLIRQDQPGNWAGVMGRLASVLAG